MAKNKLTPQQREGLRILLEEESWHLCRKDRDDDMGKMPKKIKVWYYKPKKGLKYGEQVEAPLPANIVELAAMFFQFGRESKLKEVKEVLDIPRHQY